MGCQCCRAAQWSKAKWDAASENGTKPVIWWGDNASSSRSNVIRSFLTLVVIIITGQPDKIQVWLKTVFFLRDFCNWFKGPSDALNTPQVCGCRLFPLVLNTAPVIYIDWFWLKTSADARPICRQTSADSNRVQITGAVHHTIPPCRHFVKDIQ